LEQQGRLRFVDKRENVTRGYGHSSAWTEQVGAAAGAKTFLTRASPTLRASIILVNALSAVHVQPLLEG
jgi:hypothetical protein